MTNYPKPRLAKESSEVCQFLAAIQSVDAIFGAGYSRKHPEVAIELAKMQINSTTVEKYHAALHNIGAALYEFIGSCPGSNIAEAISNMSLTQEANSIADAISSISLSEAAGAIADAIPGKIDLEDICKVLDMGLQNIATAIRRHAEEK